MNLSRDAMLDVMAYVDGELDGEALDRVEALLATSEEAAQLALELRTLGDCVRVIETDRNVDQSGRTAKKPNAIADDVMAAIDKNVVSIAPLAARRRNAVIVGAFSAALAMAAGWFMFFRTEAPPDAPPIAAQVHPAAPLASPNPLPIDPQPADIAPEIAAQADPPDRGGVDVESLESPSHDVSVFYVPTTASANPNASSVVVWIGEGEATK